MIKRQIATALALVLVLLTLAGCAMETGGEKISVVCTTFPIYDWVREVVGESESVEVVLLVRNGSDLHSFQPSASDIVLLRSCDLLVRAGGGTDGWVEEALRRSPSEKRRDLRLLEADSMHLRHVSEESVAQGHEHEHGHEHEEGCTVDEHFWLSLANAQVGVKEIARALSEIDGTNAILYENNADRYIAELSELDAEYRETVSQTEEPYLVFADRFPFVYLVEEYGIGYLAAFAGCGTDADATVDTVIRLAQTLEERALGSVVVTETSDGALAEGVLRASKDTSRAVITLDSLQTVTDAELKSGRTYLSAMKSNLEALRRALLS